MDAVSRSLKVGILKINLGIDMEKRGLLEFLLEFYIFLEIIAEL